MNALPDGVYAKRLYDQGYPGAEEAHRTGHLLGVSRLERDSEVGAGRPVLVGQMPTSQTRQSDARHQQIDSLRRSDQGELGWTIEGFAVSIKAGEH